MRQWLKRTGELLALLALGTLAFLLATAFRAWRTNPPLAQAPAVISFAQAYPGLPTSAPWPTLRPGQPNSTITPVAYPPRERPSPYPTTPPPATRAKPTGYYMTPVPVTRTYAPKPTLTPSPIPSATPIPTALPLPPSAYYAVWVENSEDEHLTRSGSIWITDPRDITSRRQIVGVSNRWVYQIAVSPDGRWLAYTTAERKARQIPLWVISILGGVPRQVAADAGQPLWTADGRALTYVTVDETRGGVAIDTTDIDSGESRGLVAGTPHVSLPLLGWSPDKQRVLYLAVQSEPLMKYEVWSVDQRGGLPQRIAAPQMRLGWPLLSPDGTKLLFEPLEEPRKILDLATGAISELPDEAHGRLAWAPAGRTLVGFTVRNGAVLQQSFDLATGQRGEVALPQAAVGQWEPVSISPDGKWLAAYGPERGLNGWLHVPSGMAVPVASWNNGGIVCAWAPSLAGQ